MRATDSIWPTIISSSTPIAPIIMPAKSKPRKLISTWPIPIKKTASSWAKPVKRVNLVKIIDKIKVNVNDKKTDKIEVLSVAELLGEGIKRIHRNESVSSLF